MNTDAEFLSLLGESSGRGEEALTIHVFSCDRRLGRVGLISGYLIQAGALKTELCKKIINSVSVKKDELFAKGVYEFSLDYDQTPLRIVVERMMAPTYLYVFGAGHVGQSVATIGALAGYNVVVIDDRSEFLTRERFPSNGIKLLQERYDQIGSQIPIAGNSAIVIVTRGHQYDEICLKQVLDANARYIGMIGSRRRVLSIFKRLVTAGIERNVLDRVHAPIGLPIGAISPQEIAIAIMAEIVCVMNGGVLREKLERGELS